MNELQITKVAWEVNRALFIEQGGKSTKSWEEEVGSVREFAAIQTRFHLDNPDAGARSSHQNWMKHKIDGGWRWGSFFDEEKKEDPNMVEFEQLSKNQLSCDVIFKAVVNSLSMFLFVGEMIEKGFAAEVAENNAENINEVATTNPPETETIIIPDGEPTEVPVAEEKVEEKAIDISDAKTEDIVTETTAITEASAVSANAWKEMATGKENIAQIEHNPAFDNLEKNSPATKSEKPSKKKA